MGMAPPLPADHKKVISRQSLSSRNKLFNNTQVEGGINSGIGIRGKRSVGVASCVDWDNLSVAKLDEIQPWMQRDNEPEDSFSWFVSYLELGACRTLTKLSALVFSERIADKSTPQLKSPISPILSEARRDYDWDRRVAAFDGYLARQRMKQLAVDKLRQGAEFHRFAANITESVGALVREDIPVEERDKKSLTLATARDLIMGKDQGYGKLVTDLNKAVNGEKQLVDARILTSEVPWNSE